MEVIKTVLKRNKKQEEKPAFPKLMTLEEIGKLKNDIFTLDRSKMLLRMFEAHGQFCASHPWEVIFVTLTIIVCVTSLSFGSTLSEGPKTSDSLALGITKCVAIAYIYLQFSKLRNLGSKYLLGITGILTLLFSFSLSAAVVNFLGSDLNSLSETMPIFLLMVDLSKACTLAKFALSSKCQDEIVSNIGQGMAMIGPMMTLDALVEALVIGVGTLSGIRPLQTMCCFGCLSVVANYFTFMTFYPACLSIVLELTGDHRRLVQIQQLAKVWQLDDENQKPNPVTQKVKMIMSAGLLFVHIHTRFTSSSSLSSSSSFLSGPLNTVASISSGEVGVDNNNLTVWQLLFQSSSGFSIDYMIIITLITILTFKYFFVDLDHSTSTQDHLRPSEEQVVHHDDKEVHHYDKEVHHDDKEDHPKACPANGDGDNMVKRDSSSMFLREVGTQTKRSHSNGSKFYINSSDDEIQNENKMKHVTNSETQTSDPIGHNNEPSEAQLDNPGAPRSLEKCIEVFKIHNDPDALTDEEIMSLVRAKHIPLYQLEDALQHLERGLRIRRKVISKNLPEFSLDNLPYRNYDYSFVKGQCCENVIGYVPVPIGVVGPLMVNGKLYSIPMATTEGCLVASVNRGCRALSYTKGVVSVVTKDSMTRAPMVQFGSILRAAEVKAWLECPRNFQIIAEAFNATSRFARLEKLMICQISKTLYIRFSASTGDAMGMNMLSKACQATLLMLQDNYFHDMEIRSLSGNFCTDKKPNAVNWIEGRGKSVVCEAIIPGSVVKNVLKTDIDTLVELNIDKNFIGSMAAGSIGGFNAHASNIVTAIFIATGQDPAQNVSSSNCITQFKKRDGDNLEISCTMPCLEVGTVGGGTILPPQAACLEMLGVRGPNITSPGLNASTLANIICSTVLAGELSLMCALASGDLVKSHLKHNRSAVNVTHPPTNPPCLSS